MQVDSTDWRWQPFVANKNVSKSNAQHEREPLIRHASLSRDLAGLRTAMFYTRTYNRIFRPGLSRLAPDAIDEELRPSFDNLDKALNDWIQRAETAA